MKTSSSGRALIEAREGRRLLAYHDSKGVLTIGVGHTGRMSPPQVRAGMTITPVECDAMLGTDLAPVETVLGQTIKVPLTQNEFDALASLGFNIGTSGLRHSTTIRKLNLGDIHGAAAAFMLWNKPAVLVSRRKAEMAQFLKPDASTPVVAIARAQNLSTRATAAKSRAVKAGGVAVASVVPAAGAAIAVTSHPTAAAVIGSVSLLTSLATGLWSWWSARRASTMAANATVHSALARTA